ncbi:SIMPL domain-containing protein [Pseudorhodobacter sp. W20_MBD10_FR17]|uniref:SIMPL domain-containing protein n=1 Tax=Pseudorhodobacter sp. W20_MBD10_FR17 TaxID=3240266 RepID=UPI003F990C6D
MRAYNSLILPLFMAFAAPSAAQTPPAQITITGIGEIAAAPDMATVTLGVTTTAKTARAAMADNASQLIEVLTTLKSAGVAPRDLQTSGLSLQPNWTNNPNGDANSIDGYTAVNQLSVRVRDLAALGATLDAAIGEGANTLNGIEFGMSAPAPLLDSARKAAVFDARHRAEILAIAAGVTLGPVLLISEASGYDPQPKFVRAAMASVPVEGGEISVSASVTITWQLLAPN